MVKKKQEPMASCRDCGRRFFRYSTLQTRCNYCESARRNEKQKEKPKPQKPRKPIAKRSKKESGRQVKYNNNRAEYLEEHEYCEVCVAEGITDPAPATEIHHIKGRIGNLLWTKKWFCAICRPHHEKVENEPEWARERGWVKTRTND